MTGGRAVLAAALLAISAGTAGAASVSSAAGGMVRWLDKVSGETRDVPLHRGETKTEGRLSITLDECRYPSADPASNAYAHLTIVDSLQTSGQVFTGWMIADSPALSALESSRYDVWILRCTN